MNPRVFVPVLVFSSAMIAGALWFAAPAPPAQDPRFVTGTEYPPLAATGPYPRIVLASESHDFGTMIVGQEQSHVFTLRNAGAAELLLGEPEATDPCVEARPSARRVPAGDSFSVEVHWKPAEPAERFREGVTLLTNDPQLRVLRVGARGRVEMPVVLQPAGPWNLGEIPDGEPAAVSTTVHSNLVADFQITGIESSNPLLTATAEPLDAARLGELQARSGHLVRISVAEHAPVGRLEGLLTIRTDVPGGEQTQVAVSGYRFGPMRLLTLPGASFDPATMTVHLGRFEASNGRRASLALFVSVPGDLDFRVLSVESEFDDLRVDVKPDAAYEIDGRQRLTMALEILPGAMPAARLHDQAVPVRVVTNHPAAPELRFRVAFASH